MTRPVFAKMGLKPGFRAIYINAPAEAVQAIDAPELDLENTLRGEFDYIHLFVTRQEEFHEHFPILKPHLKQSGTLWVSWPKAGQLKTDLTLTKVIEMGYNYGLVESKTLSIDATWSALKFTHPKPGKIYHNSYGTLPE